MIRHLIDSWNNLTRYQKSRHLFRIEMGILLILAGLSTYNAAPLGTFRAVQEGFLFGVHGLAVGTTLVGIILVFFRRPNLLQFFALSVPFFLFTFYGIQAVALGYVTNPILTVLNALLSLFLLTVYWGYTE